ncbi:MAG: RDD family protein [Dehalococcoidia bacterium]
MNETAPPQSAVVVQDVTGARVGAAIIDMILMGILFVVMSALFGQSESDDGSFSVNLSGLPFILYVLLVLGYYFVLEWKTGQTVGKMLLKIKVVSADGQPLTQGKVAVRTILRIIDGFLFYLVAFICVVATKQKQRLGDMAAGTLVVKA